MVPNMIMLLSVLLSFDNLVPKSRLVLSTVPEESEAFLSLPQDVAIDESGNIYISDALAKTVFVWKADGSYLGHFGKEGQGPGEFRFMGMGGPQAYLSTVGKQVMVYDGANRSVSFFNQDLEFESSVIFQIAGGRTSYFKATPDGNYLVYHSKFGEEQVRGVGIYNKEGKLIRQILEIPDTTYTTTMKEGKFAGITLNAFGPNLIVHYEAKGDRLIAGHSSKPSFDVYDSSGKLIKKVSFKMLEQDVTAADQDEFNQRPWIKNSSWVKANFPEKMAFYDAILPVGKNYLVYRRSPYYVNLEGILIDGEGKTLSNFSFKCGENGNLFGVNGRLIAVRTDDDGEFIIEEISLGDLNG